MDFFAHQERARRNTGVLVGLFVLAVLCIIVSIFLVAQAVFVAQGDGEVRWDMLGYVAAATLLVVGGGSLFKVQQLSQGGAAVAQLLGARPVMADTPDRLEKQLRNVVEETAIASGTPVPGVYVMDGEAGINAFAAGFTPSDAVVAVTRGCLEQLNRDELQGVIAHEFSHVANGDMRLNIRLMGVLHGILCIALAGRILLRSGFHTSGRSRGKGGGGAAAIVAFGGSLVAIGFIGVLFAKLIKAAVSRQREFLADASAVQFTRNPAGIAGALKKIGGFGSKLQSPQAEAASHMLFGNGLGRSWLSALATHPPLAERIARIDKYFRQELAARQHTERMAAPAPETPAGMAGLSTAAGAVPSSLLIEQIGNPTTEHIDYTQRLLQSLPLSVSRAVREGFTARAVIYALLLDADPELRRAQLAELRDGEDLPTLQAAIDLAPRVKQLGAEVRLPLVDLVLPALREMSPRQYEQFAGNVRRLIESDQQLTLFEFTLQKVLMRHLAGAFGRRPSYKVRYRSLEPLREECRVVLSALAYAGHETDAEAATAFRDGAAMLQLREPLTLGSREDCTLARLDDVLGLLAQCSPPSKQLLLRACAHAASQDGQIWPWEAEILRAVADTLDCPVPPVLDSR